METSTFRGGGGRGGGGGGEGGREGGGGGGGREDDWGEMGECAEMIKGGKESAFLKQVGFVVWAIGQYLSENR